LGARVKLGIASFGGDGTLTTMSSPDGKVYLYIDDAGHWGVQDSAGNPLPLAIANGGTGANTLLGARVQLGVALLAQMKTDRQCPRLAQQLLFS
jgi:hypothetical protein